MPRQARRTLGLGVLPDGMPPTLAPDTTAVHPQMTLEVDALDQDLPPARRECRRVAAALRVPLGPKGGFKVYENSHVKPSGARGASFWSRRTSSSPWRRSP